MCSFKTYISGLDELFNPGFSSSVFLIVGVPGSGASTFFKEISIRRVKSTPTSYYSLNNSISSIKEDLRNIGFNVEMFEENGSWKIISPSWEKLGEHIILEQQTRSVFLDNLSDLLYVNKNKIVFDIINNIKTGENDLPHFLLLTEGMQSSKIETALEHYSDTVIHFSSIWNSEGVSRYFSFRKLPDGFDYNKTIPFRMTRNGLLIETSLRIT